jgi:hypothetical protein
MPDLRPRARPAGPGAWMASVASSIETHNSATRLPPNEQCAGDKTNLDDLVRRADRLRDRTSNFGGTAVAVRRRPTPQAVTTLIDTNQIKPKMPVVCSKRVNAAK